ncbi:hypothetical protein TSOC_012655 [Tetrabaena socialis]|uniref:Uncharacterized protein n=1 Tax=Tetrabaena socialis TaxID=47790 RepID=A0A2J7ZMF3_9CHLO|nr:hypothetical protein TSOC_012655 [Tetrabaena socialis]|eukprot:PNH01454.1 hypothetical protein TSOC_012655 [Tetrabaena socialis]
MDARSFAVWAAICAVVFSPGCRGQGTDFANPLQLLSSLATLPPMQQGLMLTLAGVSLQLQTGMDCNIFGGMPSCKALPADSSYLQQCPGADPKVDCAFFSQVHDNLYDSPAHLARHSWAPPADACPQCFDKLQRLWCALASPRCGTFQTYTRLALLPALTSVVRSYNKGDSEVEALADAVVGSVDALGAALPCREMCEDLVATCGCSSAQADTFGKLLEWMASQAPESRMSIPPAFQRLLFKRIWDRPFCSLFAPRASANFTGTCAPDAAATCTGRERWCAPAPPATPGGAATTDADAVLRYVQGIVVLQLARAAAGWITDDATGLWRTKQALSTSESKQQLDDLVTRYVDGRVQTADSDGGPAQGPSGALVAAIVIPSVIGGVLLAALGLMAYRVYWSRRAESSYFELQSGAAFKQLDDGI